MKLKKIVKPALGFVFGTGVVLTGGYVYNEFGSLRQEICQLRQASRRLKKQSDKGDYLLADLIKGNGRKIGLLRQAASSLEQLVSTCISDFRKELKKTNADFRKGLQKANDRITDNYDLITSNMALAQQLKKLYVQLEDRLRASNLRIGTINFVLNEYKQSIQLCEENILHLQKQTSRDLQKMKEQLIYTAVKLDNDDTTGSGVIVYSKKNKEGRYDNYFLTAFHILAESAIKKSPEGEEIRKPVKARVFSKEGSKEYDADLIDYDKEKDIALLKLRHYEKMPHVASFMPSDVNLGVFNEVYAVGCPLGNNPLPSKGEISSIDKVIGGQKLWMINAPTIFGNSGGAISAKDKDGNYRVIGIASRISTYSNLIPTAVPHLNMFIHKNKICSWLDSGFRTYIWNPLVSKQECEKAREKQKKIAEERLKKLSEKVVGLTVAGE